ncbi:hypothetical protein ABZP36_035955 [Zizania latifolia]
MKVVVVMDVTRASKSRLAADLVGHFVGVEVVSANSMQVYRGLDALTNRAPLHHQNGLYPGFPSFPSGSLLRVSPFKSSSTTLFLPCFQVFPHHLLSIIDPFVEFTCGDFRDHAVLDY